MELTRRMKTLMVNSEHGFPSHQNMTRIYENEQTIRSSKSPTVTIDTSNTTINSITPANVANSKILTINKSSIKDDLKAKHTVVPLTSSVITPLNTNVLITNNNKKCSGGSLGSSSISSTQTNTTSSQISSQNSSPEPTQQQQQQIFILKQQQQKLVEVILIKGRIQK